MTRRAPLRIAALVATFNRAETTVSGVRSLLSTFDNFPDASVSVFVCDDQSTDCTAVRLSDLDKRIHVTTGTGSLFWGGGTARAFALAKAHGPFDAYLLYNDDLSLDHGGATKALSLLVNALESEPVIVVGSTVDAEGSLTYSGVDFKNRYRALAFQHVRPDPKRSPLPCHTFNGNFVLVPAPIFEQLNGVDPLFPHTYGDFDLGLRARDRGFRSVVAPDPVGICEHGVTRTDRLRSLSRLRRLRAYFSAPNGLAQYMRFVWRHRPKQLYLVYLLLRIGSICAASARRPIDLRSSIASSSVAAMDV